MGMKEKLVELLNNSFAEQYEKRGLLTAPHTATDLIANGVTVQSDKDNNVPSKWISVNDRLPELAGDYLGVKNYGGEDVLVDIVFYDLGWIDHNGEPETEPITHWMPLPKPPKGE